MEVENKIHIYQINGKDTVVGEKTELIVRSVWNKPRFIELQIGNGEAIVVWESDLMKAISNSTNNE